MSKTNRWQKFKVRIEDPPRRRHMVFLGGAVLANIVSLHSRREIVADNDSDGGQAQHVGHQGRMGRVGTCKGTGEARTSTVIAHLKHSGTSKQNEILQPNGQPSICSILDFCQ
jgi:hypothetical protein